jgi:Tfp pilus assembly protein PilN
MDGEHANLEDQLGPVKSLTEQGKAVQAKLDTLTQLFAKETNYVALLESIEQTIVPGAQLQRLELTGDETQPLEMQFVISDQLVAATLRNSLEESDRFKFVDIQSIGETTVQGGTEIIATYKLSYEPGQGR